MNKLLILAALVEASTGIALLVCPQIVVRLLLGAEISGAGLIMSRIAGISLIGLGVSWWPFNLAFEPVIGIVTYNTMVMLYLIVIGVRGEWVGLLLWPAVGVHALLIVLLGGAWLKQRKSPVMYNYR